MTTEKIATHSPESLRLHGKLLLIWLETFFTPECPADNNYSCRDCPFNSVLLRKGEKEIPNILPDAEGLKYTICAALEDIRLALKKG